MPDASNVVQLLEGTGLQFICMRNVPLDDPERSLLLHKETFFRPANHSHPKTPQDFSPFMICPDPLASSRENLHDIWKNPIAREDLFEVEGEQALNAFKLRWIPVPYTGKIRAKGIQETQSNNWVRLWYQLTTATSADLVLCVDTDATGRVENAGFQGFHRANLGQAFAVSPLSTAFWQSTPLKGWVNKVGRNVPPNSELDLYPEYSHFIALLQLLAKNRVLPHIQLSEALGEPVDAHLFLDVGNSRTCGIIAECLPQGRLQPDSFEKVEIRNIERPNEVESEPFDSMCAFLPSPFDPEFNVELNWSPNFRIPFVLRIGGSLRTLGAFGMGAAHISQSSLSSPKRYLWATDPEPAPWFFAVPDSQGQPSIIKGEILDLVSGDGSPILGTQRRIPAEPRYPKGTMMTFFVLEMLFQALSQINSAEYRSRKPQNFSKRILKSVVVTTPNGMVKTERLQYQRRVQDAVDLFWHYYRLPERRKPLVYLGFDEATCAQLVYLYSVIRDRLSGDPKQAFRMLGRRRKVQRSGEETARLRIASIDIGGGTSDLAIADYVNRASGPAADLKCVQLCHEGVSVAGDEVIRRIIAEIVLPFVVQSSEGFVEPGTLGMEHLKTLLGPGVFEQSVRFRMMKKLLAQQVWIPIAQRFVEHAADPRSDRIRSYHFHELFKTQHPDDDVLDFFANYLKNVINQEAGLNFRLDNIYEWVSDKNAVNKVVYNTLLPVLRIFSEAVAQYGCDLVVLGGKLSSLPIVTDILVRLCPVPPSRVVSLTDFESGVWYPFDLDFNRIKDAKTTVAVGAALWFFSERLKALPQFSITVDRSRLESAEIFIGEMAKRQISRQNLMFPQRIAERKSVSLSAPTFLGSRFIDCEASHANMLYELSLENGSSAQRPVQVWLQQDHGDKSLLSVVNAVDATGKRINGSQVRLKLKTMEEDMYWLDTGAIW